MILTLMRVAWTNLRRDRSAQVMAFILPMAFFSIFATIFGGQGSGSTNKIRLLVVDEAHSETSAALVAALGHQEGLRVITEWAADGGPKAADVPLTRARAEALVREGEAAVAMILPAGLDTSLARFDGRGSAVELLTDPSDKIAPRMAAGLLQAATLEVSRAQAAEFGGTSAVTAPVTDLMPARVQERAVVGQKPTSPMVSFYAAGLAVMFLMFSASAAGGALIEENESGTLERVLSSRVSMTQLLLGKWLWLVCLGVMQVCVMFVWGMVAFKLPLLSHLPGFAVMTLFTAACAGAFGLVLATLARTRQQLSGLANIIVLSLSAIGGSMFPRFLMSETLQKISLVGFNAWALDGYLKVFWRELPLTALWPQLLALTLFTFAFMLLARRLAARWETA